MEVTGMLQRDAVLVIEDEPTARELLHAVLEDAGYPVQAVPDLTAGLEVLRASRVPLLVLFDVVPRSYGTRDNTGADLLAALEQDAQAAEERPLSQHAYILMSSNSQETLALAVAFPPGVKVRVLDVPFRLDELRATVEQAARPPQAAE
jgi:CheY-like chemotaxis protein